MIKKIMPHLCIVVSVMMIVFLVIDSVNSAMGFLRGDVFKTFLIIYVIVSILTAAFLIAFHSKKRRRYVYYNKRKVSKTHIDLEDDNE